MQLAKFLDSRGIHKWHFSVKNPSQDTSLLRERTVFRSGSKTTYAKLIVSFPEECDHGYISCVWLGYMPE